MPIILINDAQYGFSGLCPNWKPCMLIHADIANRTDNVGLHRKEKKEKKYRPHRKIRHNRILFGHIISWILASRDCKSGR